MTSKTKAKSAARKTAASKKSRKAATRKPSSTKLVWREVTCRVRHTPNYLSKGWSHIELIVHRPKNAPLPITNTGYLDYLLTNGKISQHDLDVALTEAKKGTTDIESFHRKI